MKHPSDYAVERYSMGRLTEAKMASLEEHLLVCEDCRKRVVQTDFEDAAIREALKQWREAEPSRFELRSLPGVYCTFLRCPFAACCYPKVSHSSCFILATASFITRSITLIPGGIFKNRQD